jgi:hypothetical protein
MAETIRWCEVHGYQSFDGVDGPSCEDGVWLEGRGGWNCRQVVRILSAPGELVDPAKVDASPADILTAVRTLPGVEEIVVDIKYDAEPFMKEGPFFVDFDGEIASGLDPGRYLVVPLSEEE